MTCPSPRSGRERRARLPGATSNSGAPLMTVSALCYSLSFVLTLPSFGRWLLLRAEGAPGRSCSRPPLLPFSFPLFPRLMHLGGEERIASHAPPGTLICLRAIPNEISLEAPGTRVPKFYSLPGGSQTPDLGVSPRCRSLTSQRLDPKAGAMRFGQPDGSDVGLSHGSRAC